MIIVSVSIGLFLVLLIASFRSIFRSFYFFFSVIKLSFNLYKERCLINFVSKNKENYLDIFLNCGTVVKAIKIISDYHTGTFTPTYFRYYRNDINEIRYIPKYKVDRMETSHIYSDRNKWNDVFLGIRLPYDVKKEISSFLSEKNCLKMERSDDKKYFDIV